MSYQIKAEITFLVEAFSNEQAKGIAEEYIDAMPATAAVYGSPMFHISKVEEMIES